ncbi:MAG: AbiV family abortive infection protein [Promethearchaeota archaeon]
MDLDNWHKGISLGIDNALRLYSDALHLIKQNSYDHACFLLITAFEELGAIYYIIDRFGIPDPEGIEDFFDHRKKMALTSFNIIPMVMNQSQIFYEYLKIRRRQILSGFDSRKREKADKAALKLGGDISKRNSLWYLRNHSLYLELNEANTQFTSPKEIPREIVINLQILVKHVLTIIQVDRDLLFAFGPDTQVMNEFEKNMVNSMITVLKTLISLQEGAIDKIVESQVLSPEKKDTLTKLLLKPSLATSPEKIKEIIITLLKDLSLNIEKNLENAEFKKVFNYYLKRMTAYDRELAFYYKETFRMFDHIAKNKFKLDSFPKFFPLNLKKNEK